MNRCIDDFESYEQIPGFEEEIPSITGPSIFISPRQLQLQSIKRIARQQADAQEWEEDILSSLMY